MNLAYWRLVGDTTTEHREKIDRLLDESVEAWAPYLYPVGSDERPPDAPSWWHGDEEAAAVTQAGARTLQGRTTSRR